MSWALALRLIIAKLPPKEKAGRLNKRVTMYFLNYLVLR